MLPWKYKIYDLQNRKIEYRDGVSMQEVRTEQEIMILIISILLTSCYSLNCWFPGAQRLFMIDIVSIWSKNSTIRH